MQRVKTTVAIFKGWAQRSRLVTYIYIYIYDIVEDSGKNTFKR